MSGPPSEELRLWLVDPGAAKTRPGQRSRPDEHGKRLIPRSVKVVLIVVGLEALLMMLMIAYLVSTVAQDVEANTGVTLATIAFTGLMLAGVVAGGFAVLRGRRWGRSPLVGWQLLQIGVAAPAVQAGRWGLGAALVVLSVIGLVALVSPGVARHLHWRELPPGGLL